MIFALLSLVLGLGITGFLQTTEAFWGEEWLQDLHETLADLLIASATLHALAAIVMGRIERTTLIKAMFTGIKEHRPPASGTARTGIPEAKPSKQTAQ